MINELHLHILSPLDTIIHYVRKTVGYFDTTYKILHYKKIGQGRRTEITFFGRFTAFLIKMRRGRL